MTICFSDQFGNLGTDTLHAGGHLGILFRRGDVDGGQPINLADAIPPAAADFLQ